MRICICNLYVCMYICAPKYAAQTRQNGIPRSHLVEYVLGWRRALNPVCHIDPLRFELIHTAVDSHTHTQTSPQLPVKGFAFNARTVTHRTVRAPYVLRSRVSTSLGALALNVIARTNARAQEPRWRRRRRRRRRSRGNDDGAYSTHSLTHKHSEDEKKSIPPIRAENGRARQSLVGGVFWWIDWGTDGI